LYKSSLEKRKLNSPITIKVALEFALKIREIKNTVKDQTANQIRVLEIEPASDPPRICTLIYPIQNTK